MEQLTTKTKRRFSPKVRRSMILDSAAALIADEGLSNLSMESIGRKADVSKALMYRYFESLQELLRELLDREISRRWRLQVAEAEKAETFEELVRGTTHVYLKYVAERGLIIERLQSDTTIISLHDRVHQFRHVAVDYFSEIVVKNFDMPIELARAVTDISFGIPLAAGEYLLRTKIDLNELEDLTVSMMLGTYNMARLDHFTRKKRLKR